MITSLDLSPITKLTHEQFRALCEANPDVPIERSPTGELIIVSPTGGESSRKEAKLIAALSIWNEQTGLGAVFSSSALFKLPEGGDRSPDVAWVRGDRWQALTADEREQFPPICPDFVIELRSRTDNLKPLQEKMAEYLNSGLQLGWLIDPQNHQVELYRPGQPVQVVSFPATLSGEQVLPGFTLVWP